MDDLGVLLIGLAIICFVLFLMRIILYTYRSYLLSHHLITLELQQSRRQMAANVNNNNDNTPGVNGTDINDFSILPKSMDLPPSYDEAALNANFKPPTAGTVNNASSTLTITTNLECSNPNLTTINEPPPLYQPVINNGNTTMTTTTTLVTINNNLPPTV